MLVGLTGFAVDAGAAGGAFAAMLLVFAVAHGPGGWTTTRLLLTGVVVAAGCGAVVSLLLSLSDDLRLRGMLFWLLGDFGYVRTPWSLLVLALVLALASISIEGHTDVRGDAAYNQALSQRRAESVRAWLVAQGVAAGRLSAKGAGKARPLKTGNTEADHQANRRVEIRIRS